MQKKSVIAFVFIFMIQAMSAGLATIPSQYEEDSWQGPVLESGARSVGVLTDSQQQSMLYNQSYNGNNDNDGDGVVDSLDSDDDNDCIPDSNDTSPMDFDGDGINDESDIDDDGDGLNDSLEVSDSNASTNIYDADNDGNHDCAFFSSGSSSGGNNTGGNNTGGNNTGGNNTGGNNTGGNNTGGNNTGGNNTGGNNTGGNNTGGNNTGGNNTGGNNTGGNNTGGNNTCHPSNGPEYNLSLDNSIYHPTDTVNAVFDFFCMDNKAGIYTGVSYWVYGPSGQISSTFYVHDTSTNYYFWDLDNRSNNFSETGWLIPTGSGNMSVGNYYVYSELWDNNTHVDTANVSFSVSNSSSNGGGGNNSGGNQTSPCGSNVGYTTVYAYAPSMLMENQSFTTGMYVNCQILNSNMMLVYWIYDANNYTVYAGNQSWTGTTSNNSNFNWSVGGLSAGNYTFHAELYVNGTFVDSDSGGIMVYANNSGGGNNTNQLTYYAYLLQYCFSTAEDIEIFMTISGLNATEFYLEWEIKSGSTLVASGSPLISVNSSGIVSYAWTFNTSALNSGIYTVMLNPADSGLSNLFSNSPFYYNIEVDCNNTGGNNTGGNNTGGNNTGGNNTGGNNTGGNNTGGNNTGGNNTGNTTNDCIDNNAPTGYLTELSIWTDKTEYVLGETTYGTFYVNCTVVGEDYQLRYWIDAGASYDYGWWNWTATQDTSVITMNWVLPDAVSGYHLHGELEQDGLWLANVISDSFDIVANNSGGGNTGGNNTGGNNTGGNNTGGNNTGGNNTGGNNTGGNNTGGNNTGGNNTGGNNTGGNNTGGNNTGGNNTGGNNTVIPNTAPSVSGVSISPVLTTADDTLTCAYTVIDLDGDTTTATVTWSVNGNIILTGSDSLTGGFAVGDDVVCSVTATDGQQPSTAASASTVILPVPSVDSDDGEGLPALGTIGTMAAIAAGVFASRRKDE